MDLFCSLFGRAPIYDIVLSCLDPHQLVWFALTCRAAYLAIVDFSARAYNINRHFSRYFTDPVAFRSLQARTNTLVSGSNALQFLDRTLYVDSDLDVYTNPGHSFEVAQFLDAQGYQFVPRREPDDDIEQEDDWRVAVPNNWDGTAARVSGRSGYPLKGIAGVWTFVKIGTKQDILKIQIIEAAASPLQVILQFHSTCVMNFITSEAAYSLYPVATFAMRGSLAMYTAKTSTQGAIEKYIQRGWRIYFFPTEELARPTRPPFMFNIARRVGDRFTWVMPLNQTGVMERPPLSRASAPLKFDHVRCNGWRLRDYKGIPDSGFECHSHPLQSTVFRYNYLISDEMLVLEIRQWANKQGKSSHWHISDKKNDWVWFDSDLLGFMKRTWGMYRY